MKSLLPLACLVLGLACQGDSDSDPVSPSAPNGSADPAGVPAEGAASSPESPAGAEAPPAGSPGAGERDEAPSAPSPVEPNQAGRSEGELADADVDASTPDASDGAAAESPPDEGEEPEPGEPAFEPCPLDDPCVVLPLGDSITFGEGSSGGGYRVELFRKAVEAGQRLTFVGTANPNGPANVAGQPFPRAHQGHQGYVIDQGGFAPTASLSLVLDSALPVVDPHIVLLMIGTNDINGNNALGQAPERLSRLIEKIATSEPEALVVVAQLTPTRDPVLNARIETYNAAIAPAIAQLAEAGRHVALVDMYAPFVETPNFENALLFDRLHPNDAGYALMADIWYEAIAELLPRE